ncbi:MAG: RNA polymerase sigma factor [Opitutaceae bacterium]|nr:RNA polymerase sigma factor [Opitutaceae bacterium]
MDPDLPLIEALQAGEDLALNELIQRHREPLFRFAFRYLRDETAARDAVQETFVRVYFKAASFTPQATVKTWLYMIAVNLCRDRLRRLIKHRGDLPLDAPSDDGARTEVADTQPIPSEQSAQADRFKALQRAIDQLPHRLRLALVLCALEGKSQKEAAEIMGTTPKAVELRIHHAKVKLRELLGDLQR